MIDAHCHLDDPRFDPDRPAVLDRARRAGVTTLVCAGVEPARWRGQSELARRWPGRVLCSYGVHPWIAAAAATDGEADAAVEALAAALASPALVAPVAVGELGLDRSRRGRSDSVERQVRVLRAQLALARERDLPIVLHVVRAHDRLLRVLEGDGVPAAGGMAHAYGGSVELVERYLRLGLHLSFGGAVTGPGAHKRLAAARAVPGERLLIETDAPDLPPHGRAPGRNEPCWLPEIAATVAAARGVSTEQLAETTAANARTLFRLGSAS